MNGNPHPSWRRIFGSTLSLPLAILSTALMLGVGGTAFAEPQIQHIPPSPQPKSDIVIRAKITAAGGVLEPYLYFRKPGGEFTRVPLKLKADHYDARIPADFLDGTVSIEYYLAAFAGKDLSHGFWHSEKSPYRLTLKGDKGRTIHIKTKPADAIVDLDGETVGAAPYSAELTPGPHHVNARLPGYGHVEFDFTMPKEKDFDLPLTLVEDKGGSLPAAAAVVHPPAALVSPPPPPAPPPPKPEVVHSVAPETENPPMIASADSPAAPPPTVQRPTALGAEPAPVAAAATPPAGSAAADAPSGPTGHVSIVTEPPGAAISVDGKDYGVSPASLDLPEGSYLISATLSGFKSGSRVLNLKAGDHTDKTIKLKPAQ